MTPTQAQIYAAAGAINDALDYEHGPDEWVCSLAKAALTAAAEVDNRSASELADVLTVMERNERNATIERCAQVADDWSIHHPDIDPSGKNIAAAIRALATEKKL